MANHNLARSKLILVVSVHQFQCSIATFLGNARAALAGLSRSSSNKVCERTRTIVMVHSSILVSSFVQGAVVGKEDITCHISIEYPSCWRRFKGWPYATLSDLVDAILRSVADARCTAGRAGDGERLPFCNLCCSRRCCRQSPWSARRLLGGPRVRISAS